MRNKHPGICYRCKIWVKAGEGHFERIPGRGWKVQHAKCCLEARAARVKARLRRPEASPTILDDTQ